MEDMQSLKLAVKRVAPVKEVSPQGQVVAEVGDGDVVGQVSLHGPIATTVSRLLLHKFSRETIDPKLAQESWELTAGDLTMQATSGEPDTPELWVYVMNGRAVTNADVVSAQEAFAHAPKGVAKMLVLECSMPQINEHVEALVKFTHQANIPTRMTVSGGMMAIESYFNQRVRGSV